MNYHAEFVAGISNASNIDELISNEQEARDVRLGFRDEIVHSDMSQEESSRWMNKLETIRGQAIIAASNREEMLKKEMLDLMDGLCQESSRLANLFLSQENNVAFQDIFAELFTIKNKMENIKDDCSMLGISEEHNGVLQSVNENMLEISKAYSQRITGELSA